jgi:hypothetical protein
MVSTVTWHAYSSLYDANSSPGNALKLTTIIKHKTFKLSVISVMCWLFAHKSLKEAGGVTNVGGYVH